MTAVNNENNQHFHHLLNTTISDPYSGLCLTLVSRIGSGSFASVFLGISKDSTQHAVKTFAKHALSASQLSNIRFEARIMTQLSSHPNIVRFEACIETSTHIFLVMERCEMDLFEAITQQGAFPSAVAREVFIQVLDALEFCHEMGVYHRDLKPENILISSDFRVKLTDFGLASRQTLSRDFGCGSVRYMSPECMNVTRSKTPYNAVQNDIWSCGVLLINLLFGKNPWHEASPLDPIYARYSGIAATSSSHPDQSVLTRQFNLTRPCERIFSGIFAADPARRLSLSKLRVMVYKIQSFVKSDEEFMVPVSPIAKTCKVESYGTLQSSDSLLGFHAISSCITSSGSDSRASSKALRIDTEKQNQAYQGPDSGFAADGGDVSPTGRVKSRVRAAVSRFFG